MKITILHFYSMYTLYSKMMMTKENPVYSMSRKQG